MASRARATRNPPQANDPCSASGTDESQLEKSILRRGLATAAEIETCKTHRKELADQAGAEPAKSLLEIMVDAKVLTRSQMTRLKQESGETNKTLQIPGYQIIDKLGKGSMGVVFKAKQMSVDRIVAIKILLDALAQNKEFIKRFEREAKIAAKLSHNNIVNAIDAGEIDGHYYSSWSTSRGHDQGLARQEQGLREKEALRIILAVAEALKHADERGLIHRDIKPENMILTKEGGVKLADLGLARLDRRREVGAVRGRHGHRHSLLHQPRTGPRSDRRRYPGRHLQPRRDPLSHGHRQGPYGGETPTEVMRKHVDKNVVLVPPDHVNTNLSGGLGMVVETMMAKNREHRYRTPDDLILDLKCLPPGESPMIAGQKPETLLALTEGESDGHGSWRD